MDKKVCWNFHIEQLNFRNLYVLFTEKTDKPSCLSSILWGKGYNFNEQQINRAKHLGNIVKKNPTDWGAVAQSVERPAPGEEVLASIPAVAARTLLVGSLSV